MAKYVYLYHGGAMKSTPEEQQKSMVEWQEWQKAVGSSMIDGGTPFKGSKMIKSDGTVVDGMMSAQSVTGYTIVEAQSLDQACEWAKNCPVLKDSGSVEVMDPMSMPGM